MNKFKPGDKVVFTYDYWTLFDGYEIRGIPPEHGKVYCVTKVGLGLLKVGIALAGTSVFGKRLGTEVGYSELMFEKLEDVQQENIAIKQLIEEAKRLEASMD